MRAVVVMALGLALLAGGCGAFRRGEADHVVRGTGPAGLLAYWDEDARAAFTPVHRSGSLLLDEQTQSQPAAVVMDVIAEDRGTRRLYVETLGRKFGLPPPEVERLHAEQDRLFDTQVDFLLFFKESSPRGKPGGRSDLQHPDSPWRILLSDDDGRRYPPSGIRRITGDDLVFTFIEAHFSGIPPGTQVYRISFPKLAKTVLGRPLGRRPFRLILAGAPGTLTLQWDDPAIFYRKPKEGAGKR